MKALTIKQPFASLIVNGIKDVENRTWPTKRRERIYIHVSQSQQYSRAFLPNILTPAQFEASDADWLTQGIWTYSAIIGEVEIVDCLQDSKSIWALPDNWHWVLANPVLYRNPILNIKGKLSFWEYEPTI